MRYRVTAPLVLVRDEKGRTHHAYHGALVEVIDADHATYLLGQGMLVAEGKTSPAAPIDVSSYVDVDDSVDVEVSGGDPAADLPSRPPHVASKARWIDYAVSEGFDRAEAESMSKQALIASLK